MKRIIVVAVTIALMAIAACKQGAPGEKSEGPNPPFQGEPPEDAYVFQGEPGVYGGQIVLELKNDPRTFNIILASDENTAFLLQYHVNRWLIDYRNGGDPPDYDSGLCKKWEISDDGKQWTFYLRRGVRWSDGEPFTADDLMFTYDVIRDKKVETAIRDVFREGTDAGGNPIYPQLEKVDDYTVRFTLGNANAMFLDQAVNFFPIPKHKWEQVWRNGNFNEAMKLDDNLQDLVSLGPFRIKEYVSGQRVVLERNPYFWKVDKKGQRLPYLDRIVFVTAKDFNTVAAKFQAGELDIMSRVRAEDYAQVKKMESPDIVIRDIGVVLDTQWLTFNQNNSINPATGKPYVEPWKQRIFRDQKFRQAISYSIDRDGLINTVYVGRAVPLFSFVTPADKYWFTDDVMKYPYDPARARQMLAELGLKDTDGDGVLEDSEGHKISFSIYTNSENSQRIRSVAFIIKNLQDIGIQASSATTTLERLTEIQQSIFSFDAMVLGWGAAVPPGPTNTKNITLSSGLNHACFARQAKPSTAWEAQIDDLVHEVDATLDAEARKQKFAQVQRIWSEQLPEINLVAQKEAIAYKNKFGNLLPSPYPPRVTWNAEEIYIKK
ncbi:MAG TPA: ABC transporter substrate-binding protein [Blastocatellia bacterium]|nr:ABC transporter substrate-binding protein [Blastocatellia bacterium]